MKFLDKLFKKLKKKSRRLYRSGWNVYPTEVAISSFGSINATSEDKRKTVKPKAVMKELFSDKKKKVRVDLTNLDEKIKAIKKRRDFMEYDLNLSTHDEEKVLNWLKARKKFKKYASLFKWRTTTPAMIQKLLKEYKLNLGEVITYKRCIPAEAIEEMEKFTDAYGKVEKSPPQLKIIADIDETKKDPIILGQSPFGNYFYVLGAWDKEVEIMDELYG